MIFPFPAGVTAHSTCPCRHRRLIDDLAEVLVHAFGHGMHLVDQLSEIKAGDAIDRKPQRLRRIVAAEGADRLADVQANAMLHRLPQFESVY